ncbi:probable N-acetyltransferase camello [Sparus aurata]|uniref:probable N-acetyltransferase camello n=1 Tax=Sparus aurata TaxID=8175 RepID=UPI0011C1A562|nr:probable N-acetyltransferase camello [Sparus aurata]XP_030277067.1 probable N-acetyltransferase camello [Sparus aurata]XP_030277068.1 probable N-acetyltransferase camello [Sparus aurata]
MQLVIRRYRPSDKDTVLSLFSITTLGLIQPCFNMAISSPLYITITLALCVAGYLLGSVLGAVVLPGAWVGLVYCCCYGIYSGYLRRTLKTDMQDIPGKFLSRPDDCYWVAEAEVEGLAKIVGMVAVVGKENGNERYGELFRMSVSPTCRRMGIGARLTETVFDFCKERGFSAVMLSTSSPTQAAVALYKKLGFSMVPSHNNSSAFSWILRLARVTVFRMKKQL